MSHYEDGWYYGFSPKEELEFYGQDEHRYVQKDCRNVVGRFRNHAKVDAHASREARREVLRPIVILETRNIRTVHGAGSDVSVQEVRFDYDCRSKSLKAVERFKDAWTAYQAERTVPVSDDEVEALAEIGITVAPKPVKAPRKPRAKKQAENVVTLKTVSA
jgi:hypothetical protein